MPYSKDELDNLPFYQELITGDESKYLEMIEKRTESGTLNDGILRINLENVIPDERKPKEISISTKSLT